MLNYQRVKHQYSSVAVQPTFHDQRVKGVKGASHFSQHMLDIFGLYNPRIFNSILMIYPVLSPYHSYPIHPHNVPFCASVYTKCCRKNSCFMCFILCFYVPSGPQPLNYPAASLLTELFGQTVDGWLRNPAPKGL